MADPLIRVLVGVRGATISGDSGRLIKKELNSLAKAISSESPPKITISLNEEATKRKLQSQLDKIAKGLKVEIGGTTSSNQDSRTSKTKYSAEYQKYLAALKEEYSLRTKLERLNGTSGHDAEINALNSLIATKQKDTQAAYNAIKASEEQAKAAETQIKYQEKLSIVSAKTTDKIAKQTSAEGDLNKQLNLTANASMSAAVKGKFFGEQLSGITEYAKRFITLGYAIMVARRTISEMVDNVTEIDSAMIELKKVTEETDSAYTAFLSDAAVKAKELHSSITTVISATTGFARLGYSISESSALANAAIIYSNVGDEIENIDEATKSIISTMTAFGIETGNIMRIVDVFNEVGNNFAISSGGLGEALQRSAASMSAAGNTLEQSVALITAANTIVQNPEVVGTAFKTMAMRIRSSTSELEAAGEEIDDYVKSSSKLRAELQALTGVDIMTADGTDFKSTYQILEEISKVWSSLKGVDQANVLEIMFGKRQGNVGAAVLNNFDIAKNALATALSSAGSAEEEFAKWTDSIEAKLQRLEATWQSLSQSFISSDLVKWVIDSGTSILGLLDSITQKGGALTAILPTLAGVLGMKNSGFVIQGNNSTGGIRGSNFGWNFITKSDLDSLGKYNVLLGDAATSQEELAAAFSTLSPAAQRASKNLDGTAQSLAMLKSTGAGVVGVLKNIGLALLQAGAVALAFAAVNFVVSLIDKAVNAVEYAKQATDEAIASFEESKSKIDELNDKLYQNKTRIEELNKLKLSGDWNIELQKELTSLGLQNKDLERQLELEKQINAEKNREARNALRKEVDKVSGKNYNFVEYTSEPVSLDGYSPNTILSSVQFTTEDYLTKATSFLNGIIARGSEPSQYEDKTIDEIKSNAFAIADEYLASLEKAREIGDSQTEALIMSRLENVSAVLALIAGAYTSSPNPRSQIKEWTQSRLSGSNSFYRTMDEWRTGSIDDFLANNNENNQTAAYKAVSAAAAEYEISVRGLLEILKELGYFQDALTGGLNETASGIDSARQAISSIADETAILKKSVEDMSKEDFDELLSAYPQLTDEVKAWVDGQITAAELQEELNDLLDDMNADEAADAFESLVSAFEEYGENSSQVEESIEQIEELLPGVTSALYDENGALRDGAAAAMGSRYELEQFILAQLNSQIAAAEADYSNLCAELGAVSDEAQLAAQNLQTLKAARDGFLGYTNNAPDAKKPPSGGGGGKSSILSKEYEAATELADHYIELSELTQKRMEEGSDEWLDEQEKQYDYTKQKAELIAKELERLAAKGYDETNTEFAKLRREYEKAQNALYDVAKGLWEAQRDIQINALKDRIDSLEEQKEAIEKLKEAEEKRWEAREEQLDYEISMQEALIDAAEAYYNIQKSFRTERSELEGHLKIAQANAAAYAGTSIADTLFNEEDYKQLTDKLDSIAKDADALYEDVLVQINEVTKDNVEELGIITSAFERQYELKLKEYEVAKQDLAVARARKDLENTMNERNVMMLVNGAWTWVADPEAVQGAVESVNEAEANAIESLSDLADAQRLALLNDALDGIEKQKILEEAAHDKIIEGYEAQIEAIDAQIDLLEDQIDTLEDMEFVFDEFIKTLSDGVNSLKALANSGKGGRDDNGSRGINSDNDKPVVVVVDKQSAGFTIRDGKIMYYKGKKGQQIMAYADGGVAPFTGLARLDGTPANPEVVFNNDDAAKLYALVHNTPNLIKSVLDDIAPAAISAGRIGRIAGSTSVASDNSRTVYIQNVQLDKQDSASIISIMERVVPSLA